MRAGSTVSMQLRGKGLTCYLKSRRKTEKGFSVGSLVTVRSGSERAGNVETGSSWNQVETLTADYSAVFPYSKTREKHRLLLGSGL